MGLGARARKLTLGIALAVVLGVVFLPSALAWSSQYYTNTGSTCMYGGQGAITGWYSNINFNAISSWSVCYPGGTDYLGTNYMRSDGTRYGDKWSSDWFHGISDTRTISYGRAICEANGSNPSGTAGFFCITGS